MTDAGFFKGTSADQDTRFADKKKKLMKSMRFEDSLNKKIDMHKVNMDSVKPWIAGRITELLDFEDEVVVEYVINQLQDIRHPDPKEMQINMTGFLNAKNARIFLGELWELLCSATENESGIPSVFLEAKKEELRKRQETEERIRADLRRKEEEIQRTINIEMENQRSKRRGWDVREERESDTVASRHDRNTDFYKDRSDKDLNYEDVSSKSPNNGVTGGASIEDSNVPVKIEPLVEKYDDVVKDSPMSSPVSSKRDSSAERDVVPPTTVTVKPLPPPMAQLGSSTSKPIRKRRASSGGSSRGRSPRQRGGLRSRSRSKDRREHYKGFSNRRDGKNDRGHRRSPPPRDRRSPERRHHYSSPRNHHTQRRDEEGNRRQEAENRRNFAARSRPDASERRSNQDWRLDTVAGRRRSPPRSHPTVDTGAESPHSRRRRDIPQKSVEQAPSNRRIRDHSASPQRRKPPSDSTKKSKAPLRAASSTAGSSSAAGSASSQSSSGSSSGSSSVSVSPKRPIIAIQSTKNRLTKEQDVRESGGDSSPPTWKERHVNVRSSSPPQRLRDKQRNSPPSRRRRSRDMSSPHPHRRAPINHSPPHRRHASRSPQTGRRQGRSPPARSREKFPPREIMQDRNRRNSEFKDGVLDKRRSGRSPVSPAIPRRFEEVSKKEEKPRARRPSPVGSNSPSRVPRPVASQKPETQRSHSSSNSGDDGSSSSSSSSSNSDDSSAPSSPEKGIKKAPPPVIRRQTVSRSPSPRQRRSPPRRQKDSPQTQHTKRSHQRIESRNSPQAQSRHRRRLSRSRSPPTLANPRFRGNDNRVSPPSQSRQSRLRHNSRDSPPPKIKVIHRRSPVNSSDDGESPIGEQMQEKRRIVMTSRRREASPPYLPASTIPKKKRNCSTDSNSSNENQLKDKAIKSMQRDDRNASKRLRKGSGIVEEDHKEDELRRRALDSLSKKVVKSITTSSHTSGSPSP